VRGINREHQILSERLRNDDELAFELVFMKFKGRLFDFVKKSLPREEDVEGIVQEVFIKIWQNRKQLDPQKSLDAFLFSIAKNEVFDHLRKLFNKRKYLDSLYHSMEKEDSSTQKQMEYNELRQVVYDAIERLPERRREIFKLSRLQGKTYKEIAIELQISENTVDTQMRKSLHTLHNYLDQYLRLILLVFLS